MAAEGGGLFSSVGGDLRDAESEEARRAAARLMGQSTSPRKLAAIAQNAKRGGRPKGMKMSEESRAKLREAWARRKQEQEKGQEQ